MTKEETIKAGGAGALFYSVSKKLAEKAAYDFVQNETDAFFQNSFICPLMLYSQTEQPGVNKSNFNTSGKTIYNVSLTFGEFDDPSDELSFNR